MTAVKVGAEVNLLSTIKTVRTSPPVKVREEDVYSSVSAVVPVTVVPVGTITIVTVCEAKLTYLVTVPTVRSVSSAAVLARVVVLGTT